MNFFFNTGRASRASQNNQDTAFFQAGQASKTSIFDNQQPSETQYAYELFNQESREQNNKQKSIISKLDQFNRDSDFVQLPNNSHQNQNLSSDQNESKMTFGMKLSNKLYESNVGQSKPKTFKSLLEKQPSGMKNDQLNNIVKINKDYSSNFSLKIDSFERPPAEIESVPLEMKGSKNRAFQTAESLSSSSFDLEEYRNKNILKKQKGIEELPQKHINVDSQPKQLIDQNSRQNQKRENSLFPSLNSNGIIGEKRQLFCLRRSKVEENSKEKPIKFSFNKDSNFSSTSNTIQNPLTIAPQKTVDPPKHKIQQSKIEPRKTFMDLQKANLRKSGVKQPLGKFSLSNFKMKDSNELLKPLANQNSQKELIESPPNGKKAQIQKKVIVQSKIEVEKSQSIEKEKKQALGLKEQLKKLGSRPTEKVQLKSIAYTPTFKFKNKLQLKQSQPQMKPQILKHQQQSSTNRETTKNSQNLPKPSKFISTIRDDKTEPQANSKSHRSSQFSRAMLALMQVQQQSQNLRQKVVHSRNTYRQLAIINDDISKRIDQVLKRATRK